MNDTDIVTVREVLGFKIGYFVERHGAARSLHYSGHLFFDGSEVENRGHAGRNRNSAEKYMRLWCESLTEAQVRVMVDEEVEGERHVIAKQRAVLAAREACCEALARKLGGPSQDTLLEISVTPATANAPVTADAGPLCTCGTQADHDRKYSGGAIARGHL